MSALAAMWAALVLAVAWRIRPRPEAAPRGERRRAPARLVEPVTAVAALVLPTSGALVLLVVAVTAPRVLAHRARTRRRDEIRRSLPEIVDLVHVAVGAGLTVRLAIDAVSRVARGPIAAELTAAMAEVELGRRVADALADVPARTSEDLRPLVAALVASDRYGAPLGDALDRLAADVRADRRRRAEEAARKVPVKLLFPLVCCVLPAFGLLTLAPLIAGALAALRL